MAEEAEKQRESGPLRVMLEPGALDIARDEILVPLPEDVNQTQATYLRNVANRHSLRTGLPSATLRAVDTYALHRRGTPHSFAVMMIRNDGWLDVMAKADRRNKRKLHDWAVYIATVVPNVMRDVESWLTVN